MTGGSYRRECWACEASITMAARYCPHCGEVQPHEGDDAELIADGGQVVDGVERLEQVRDDLTDLESFYQFNPDTRESITTARSFIESAIGDLDDDRELATDGGQIADGVYQGWIVKAALYSDTALCGEEWGRYVIKAETKGEALEVVEEKRRVKRVCSEETEPVPVDEEGLRIPGDRL